MDHALLQRVELLLHGKHDRELQQLALKLDTPELADMLDSLEHGKRKIFLMLPPEKQAAVSLVLSDASLDRILPRIAADVMTRMLHFLDEDNATDMLQELPKDRQEMILQGMSPGRKKRIEKLLTFAPDTAGGLMDLAFLELPSSTTLLDAMEAIQKYAKEFKQVPVVLMHVADEIHWVPARALVSGWKQLTIGALSIEVPSISHTNDREDVLDVMGKENSDIVCVTDDLGKLLGVIHLNDLLRIAEAEASEDAYRMAAVGTMDADYLDMTFASIWKKRVGWLSVLFVAELFTFTALAHFESSIAAVTALALFIPLCISAGGNSGSQAATLVTRAMALGDVTTRDWFRVLRRELLMGIALGVTLGIVGFARAAFTPQSVLGDTDRWMMAIVIAQSVAVICLWGTLVGSMLPIFFKKIGFDPAYASSPFVATFVDVTGIVLYFSIAEAFIL